MFLCFWAATSDSPSCPVLEWIMAAASKIIQHFSSRKDRSILEKQHVWGGPWRVGVWFFILGGSLVCQLEVLQQNLHHKTLFPFLRGEQSWTQSTFKRIC